MVYHDWDSLEKGITDKLKSAILDIGTKANQELQANLERFYDTPEPFMYERTGHLRNSWDYDYTEMGNTAVVQLFLDSSDPYDTGTYTTQMVLENAETHYLPPTAPWAQIKGNPYFWRDTMDKIENEILPMSMLGHGFVR